jgi:uncharacterized protein
MTPIRSLIAACLATALSTALPASAQTPPVQERIPLLSLNGQGTIEAKPEVATIQVGVATISKVAKEAIDENSRLLAAALKAAKETGIEPRDIQTTGLYLQPNYSNNGGSRRDITGYSVNNVVTMRVRDLEKIGGLLDRLVVLGINDIRNVSFSNAAPSPFIEQARAAAIKDVMDKAQKYADAANLRIVRVLTLNEGNVQIPGVQQNRYMYQMSAQRQAEVPVEAGELVYRANVTATFEIAPK